MFAFFREHYQRVGGKHLDVTRRTRAQQKTQFFSPSCLLLRPSHLACIRQLKADRDDNRVVAALAALRASAASTEVTSDGKHPMNLVKLSIDAAKARCVREGVALPGAALLPCL